MSSATATGTPVVFVDDVHAGYLPGVNILNGCSLVAHQGEPDRHHRTERCGKVHAPEGHLRTGQRPAGHRDPRRR